MTSRRLMQHSLLWILLCSIVCITALAQAAPTIPAFPGAEGFGAQAVGGRGGTVHLVTNLNDRGAGSLRACAEASGPRTCIFRIGGTIEFDSPIVITNPFITIAGQTAPGDGITLRNKNNTKAPIEIWTHEVIIRYLRSRPGPSPQGTENGRGVTIANSNPTIKPHNIIIDHCSFSWSTDELVIIWYDAHDVTYQWNVISEGLMCSTHNDVLNEPERCDGSFDPIHGHSFGALVGGGIDLNGDGDYDRGSGPKNITFHHNLFAHNGARNPLIKASGIAQVVNNVMYNPMWSGSQTTDKHNISTINYVGNYFKPGPSSRPGHYMISAKEETGYGIELYLKDNIGPNRPTNDLDELLVVKPRSHPIQTLSKHPAPTITTHSCDSLTNCEAYDVVLQQAGAKHGVSPDGTYFARPDAVDKRIVAEVKTGTGRIIDAPSLSRCYGPYCERYLTPSDYTQHGISDPIGSDGWPIVNNGTPPTDTDQDGMPDSWEHVYAFDPNDASDGVQDADIDGYTNLEEYLNSTNPRPEDWSPSGDTTPPVLSNIQVTNITDNSATITWNTDEAADSTVAYGLQNTYTDTPTSRNLLTVHSVTLTGLQHSTVYQYQVSSTDQEGNTATSESLTFTTNAAEPTPEGKILTSQVTASSDDAEESDSGKIQRTSFDLDLGDKNVGIRFQEINIPQGATIKHAYIQFTVDEKGKTRANFRIQGQAHDNAPEFDRQRHYISTRPLTSARVDWETPVWNTIGAAGFDQRTPNLAAIVQEIVNRPGWMANNSLAFIINGSGHREADSYNGRKKKAPILHVEY
ncbi:MAG: hypothetical protein NPIRA05_11590 [Nitrospirales bacterium]|nr:MAG: hypothetical protein NPIRA05_11590 [Nitrospirales bacterium]